MSKVIVVVGFGPGVSTAVAGKFGAKGFSIGLIARGQAYLTAGVEALKAKGVASAAFAASIVNGALWNGAATLIPAVLTRCSDLGNVKDAVRIARNFGVPVSVPGGGHDCAARAVGPQEQASVRAYYGDAAPRRALAKARYDPDDQFSSNTGRLGPPPP